MKKILTLYIYVVFASGLFAQTLDKRWTHIIEKSNTYNSHKIIKGEELHDIWASVQDSLTMTRLKVKQEQKKLANQTSEIAGLNAKLNAANARFNEVLKEKNKMESGAARADSYIATLWIVVGIAIALSAIMFLLYNKSNAVTRQKKNEYEQLQKTFEEYKTTRLEVERKLKREIQTYMNKFEEMKIKI